MRLFLSEASVHLSRQFLEKLTDSAIIKIALWEDLSGEVATGLAVACGFTGVPRPRCALGKS
jgi:hypothetical protein